RRDGPPDRRLSLRSIRAVRRCYAHRPLCAHGYGAAAVCRFAVLEPAPAPRGLFYVLQRGGIEPRRLALSARDPGLRAGDIVAASLARRHLFCPDSGRVECGAI